MKLKIVTKEDISGIIEHEKNLYWAFKTNYPEYAESFFQERNSDRLIPNIPYDSQKIYVLEKENKIVSAMSICHDSSIKYEVEEMGFKIDKNSNTAEALHFYDKHEKKDFEIIIDAWRGLFEYLKDDLNKQGINQLFTSCSKKLLAFYKYTGWEVIEKKEIFNETEYLFSYKW